MVNDKELLKKYENNWIKFAEEVLGIDTLDEQQEKILRSIQNNRKVSMRSGNARGKDFISSVASLCFLYLHYPSKVICTAPTGRQVYSIIMTEVGHIWDNANIKLGGRKLHSGIKLDEENWFMLGFKAGDKSTEAWQGYHSENIMVVVTEATGIEENIYEAIEGILTGNSKLILAFNPIVKQGETYKSTTDSTYEHFQLNCMNAPNVTNYEKVLSGEWIKEEYKRKKIPGQVDWKWVDDKVGKRGWSYEINKNEFDKDNDFKWRNKYYRALDPFRVRVLGKYPKISSDKLIPLEWLERSHRLWSEYNESYQRRPRRVGVDIAGQGSDRTVFISRYGNYIPDIDVLNIEIDDKIHMHIAGKVIAEKKARGGAFILDTIGEGAGVFSRLAEQEIEDVYSCKVSNKAKGLTDFHGIKEFSKLRDFLFWAVRDALDPKNGFDLMLPPNSDLDEEMIAFAYKTQSNGLIKIRAKDDIRAEIGRSPDIADALAMTFTPI